MLSRTILHVPESLHSEAGQVLLSEHGKVHLPLQEVVSSAPLVPGILAVRVTKVHVRVHVLSPIVAIKPGMSKERGGAEVLQDLRSAAHGTWFYDVLLLLLQRTGDLG